MGENETSAPQGSGGLSKDEKMWGMLAHVLGLVGFIGPLIVWLIKREAMPFVNDQGKEALNFQITVLIAFFACGVLSFLRIGCFLIPAVSIANIVFIVMAAMKANEGVAYRYPIALRLIK